MSFDDPQSGRRAIPTKLISANLDHGTVTATLRIAIVRMILRAFLDLVTSAESLRALLRELGFHPKLKLKLERFDPIRIYFFHELY